MIKEIAIPDIGEKVDSITVIGLLVSPGDNVEVDQGLIEVETDKAVVEVPSPEKGKIVEVTVKVGDSVKVEQVIAKIDVSGESSDSANQAPELQPERSQADDNQVKIAESQPEPSTAVEPDKQPPVEAEKGEEAIPETSPGEERPAAISAPAPPSTRRLARELGVSVDEIAGTGPGGRITRDDVKAHVKKIMSSGGPGPIPGATPVPLPDFTRWGEVTREKMTTIRGIIAQSMSHAWQTVPQVTQFDEADITELENFRKKFGSNVEHTGGKLTVTAILIKTLTAALQRFPRFNASLDTVRNEIVYKKYIHMAIAVDTDRGLLVPVIKDVDKKNIRELSIELTDIAERARNKKIKPDELEGGTFTISNQGGIGGTNFTPIVYWPQVAILGVSRSREHPAHVGSGHVESRNILPLALSYDHRIVDGADAARFLHWVADALESPLLLNLDS